MKGKLKSLNFCNNIFKTVNNTPSLCFKVSFDNTVTNLPLNDFNKGLLVLQMYNYFAL